MLYTAMFVYILLNGWFSKHIRGSAENKQRWLIITCFILLFIVSGCRFQTGAKSDIYRNYMHTYSAALRSWADVFTISKEFLHGILRKIIIEVFRDPQAYFFITAAFIVGVALITIKKYSNDVFLGILLYFVWGGYFASNNVTRQYIAITIGLIAIKYIIEEKPPQFAVCMILAMGFHASAVVLIPLYFLSKTAFNKNILIIYALLAAVLVVLNGPVTRLMQIFLYSDYGAGYGTESSNVLRLVWPLIVFFFLVVINRNKYQCSPAVLGNNPRQIELFNNLICHGSILYIYFSLLSAVNMLMFSRVAAYYSQYALFCMTFGIDASNSRRNRKLLKVGVWTLSFLWFIAMNCTGKYIPTPYTPFWKYPLRLLP